MPLIGDTANQPFGEWARCFPFRFMTLSTVDPLVHHATILEMNVERTIVAASVASAVQRLVAAHRRALAWLLPVPYNCENARIVSRDV